ncbi:MAG: NAD(P)/FAD-dependent oxidoreductase [Halieaceae bacterium]|jgi:phytoene dehydrogenase-like protein|nr:NAD(P)/FAD-dependent oxidoreductase [Halieaceae bacterium]
MADTSSSDVIVIGAGHNGLVCAAYLAKAGLSVRVLEARPVIGGAACTEEFHPGFRNSVYSYSISLLHPKIISELRLEEHGLEIMERPAGSLSLLEDGHMQLTRDGEQARAEIARFSKRDAGRIDAFEDEIAVVARALRSLATQAPPNFGGGWRDVLALLKGGNQLRRLDSKHQVVLAELMTRSLGDHLDAWFEGDPLKGLLGFEGVIGNFADPYQAGTAYILLHHAFGEVKGREGAWGIARGGMGAISDAIASVARIIEDDGAARGVITEDGREFHARTIAANLHPQLLLTRLLDGDRLPADTLRRISAYRSHSATFRMNVALSELPRFSSLPADETFHFKGAIELCPSLGYMQEAYREAKADGWTRKPIISMQIPSTQDDSLAPAGAHVASLFCQHFQRELPGGQSWDEVKDTVADSIIGAIDAHAPNFRASVVGRQIKSPLDIERDLNMVGGDIFHGALHLDQFYSMRPVPGLADHRMPTKGVYLCGSGAHPGGGVSGLPGHNAAQVILRDR